METQVDEIADGIYRLSTFVPEVGPTGFTFNQFLIDDEQPLLFHTGHRMRCSRSSSDAIDTITPVERLRWITFGHVEADECGVDEPVPRRRARTRGRPRRRSGAWCRSTTWPTVRPCRWPTVRSSSSVASGPPHRHAARPPRLGGPGALRGDHEHVAVRRPVHASWATGAALTSDDIVEAARSRPKTSSVPRCITPQHRADDAHVGRARAHHPRRHARLVVHRRRCRRARGARGELRRSARGRRDAAAASGQRV